MSEDYYSLLHFAPCMSVEATCVKIAIATSSSCCPDCISDVLVDRNQSHVRDRGGHSYPRDSLDAVSKAQRIFQRRRYDLDCVFCVFRYWSA